MKKFLTVLLVIAVMFTFSFGSAFAADQTIVYDKQDEYDELHTAEAYTAKVGKYGITEAYKTELVDQWQNVLDDEAVTAGDTQAATKFRISSDNYYAVEKAEAKALVEAAIAGFKTATTANAAKDAEDALVKKLNKLTKEAVEAKMLADSVDKATYLDNLDVALGNVLSTSAKAGYLLPEYGYFNNVELDKAEEVKLSTVTGKANIYAWFMDMGYRTLDDAKAHIAEFKAALVALTDAEIAKIQAEYDAIDTKAKAAKDAYKAGGTYYVASVDGIDLAALDAIYAEQEAYEDKYCKDALDGEGKYNGKQLFKPWTVFTGDPSTQGFLVYAYANQYASEIKAVDLKDEAAVVALVDKIDDARDAFDADEIVIPAPTSSKEYTALTKAYDDFKDAAEAALVDAGDFDAYTVVGTKAYFDASEKNVKALEANRAAYDKLAKLYSIYDDAKEAKILAGEHNRTAATGYNDKIDKIDESIVQAYLNNATVKVTTRALGNNKIRVNAKIDTESFKMILGEMSDGCTVSYKFYHKTEKADTFKASKEKDRNYITYTKTSLKKGVKYKFQCAVTIKDADGNVVATKDYKASTVGSRVCR